MYTARNHITDSPFASVLLDLITCSITAKSRNDRKKIMIGFIEIFLFLYSRYMEETAIIKNVIFAIVIKKNIKHNENVKMNLSFLIFNLFAYIMKRGYTIYRKYRTGPMLYNSGSIAC